MYIESKYFLLESSDTNFESQDADSIPSQHISFKFHGIGPFLRMWYSSPCKEIPRFHGTQKFITAVKILQLDPIINNKHSHILFIYEALHAIFLPSSQLRSDLFHWGVFLSLLHTCYMPLVASSPLCDQILVEIKYVLVYDSLNTIVFAKLLREATTCFGLYWMGHHQVASRITEIYALQRVPHIKNRGGRGPL
jgi:hypothetical protein